MRLLRVVVAVAGVGIGASCAGPAPVEVELPHHNIPAVGASGVATGGVLRYDGRCLWLEYESGAGANLIWPTGFRALAKPLELYGAAGSVIAREGDTVELGVADSDRRIPGCSDRPAFVVGEVSSVNGAPWPDGTPAVDARTPVAGKPK